MFFETLQSISRKQLPRKPDGTAAPQFQSPNQSPNMSYSTMLKRKSPGSGPSVTTQKMPGLNVIRSMLTMADGSMLTTCDNNKITMTRSDFGQSSTVMAGASSVFEGNTDGDGNRASFGCPMVVAMDLVGNVVVVDKRNNVLRFIYKLSGVVRTFAGNGRAGYMNGMAQNAEFNSPTNVVAMKDGHFVVSDTNNHCLRVVAENGTVGTLCHRDERGCEVGNKDEARFNSPRGLVVTRDGDLLVMYCIA